MESTLQNEIDELDKMNLPELQARFHEITGDTNRSPNTTFLKRRIIETLQAKAGLSQEARAGSGNSIDGEPKPKTSSFDSKEPESTAEGQEDRESTEPAPDSAQRLTRLSVGELQALYLEVVGRPTRSENQGYLVWKIREAQKGRVAIGPRQRAHREGVEVKVLPLRLEADLVEQLDAIRKRQGLRSRADLFRASLQTYLRSIGEDDAVKLLVVDTEQTRSESASVEA